MSIKMKALAILLSIVVLAGVAVASACSTRTPGYWKNHYPDAWKTVSGTVHYIDNDPTLIGLPKYDNTWTLPGGSQSAALAILNTPVRGDARINLQQKVIAAILSVGFDNRHGWAFPPNYNAGGGGPTLPALIDQALTLLNTNSGPWTLGTNSAVRTQGLALASAIDYWLNYFDEAPIT